MPDSESPPRITRLSRARRGGRVATPPSVPELPRRPAALERQVEEALAASAQPASWLPPLESVLDGMLMVANRLRGAAAGGAEAAAGLVDAAVPRPDAVGH